MRTYDKSDLAICELRAVINDTTYYFDLLGGDGIHVSKWEPQRPVKKSGGVFQDSPMVDGRRFVFGRKGNVRDKFELTYVNDTPEGAVFDDRKLFSFLETAELSNAYSWSDSFIYLAIKTKGVNALEQYTLVISAELKDAPNPAANPFMQPNGSSVWTEIQLETEHGFWSINIPGEGTAVKIGVEESFNGVTFGNFDSNGDIAPSTDLVYINSIHTHNNITNVHLGTAGANLIGTVGAYNILSNANPLYIGMSNAVSGYGRFNNVQFYLTTAATGTYTLAVEYWNGATWTAVNEIWGDDSESDDQFSRLGHVWKYWTVPSNWATNTPGGSLPTGYWVRIRVSSGSLSTVPQQTGNVQSITWPYIEIQSDQIGGDVPALAHMVFTPQSQNMTEVSGSGSFAIGIRSVSRGEDFTACLNCASGFNPSGVTFSTTGTFATGTNRVASYVEWSPAVEGEDGEMSFVFDSTIAEQYAGRYKVLLQFAKSVLASTDFKARAQVVVGSTTMNGNWVSPDGLVLDLGEITIPSDPIFNTTRRTEINISLVAGSTGAGGDIIFYSMWVIPVDEYAILADVAGVGYESTVTGDAVYGDVDSIQIKQDVLVTTRELDGDALVSRDRKISNGPFIIPQAARLRVWILQFYYSVVIVSPSIVGIQLYKQERFSMFVGKSS